MANDWSVKVKSKHSLLEMTPLNFNFCSTTAKPRRNGYLDIEPNDDLPIIYSRWRIKYAYKVLYLQLTSNFYSKT